MKEKNICPCGTECTMRSILNMVGGKWKLPVICALITDGPSRYNELLKKIQGISNTMLSQTLKEMETDGLVERKEYLEVPVRVEYAVTEKSRKLEPIMLELIQWAKS